MASLDVSDAFDESFFEHFNIIRRTEVVGNDGFGTTTKVTMPSIGVITMASPNDLERMPEADVSTKAITITTQARLQIASKGKKADLVQALGGEFYQVVLVEDYSRYGQGYIWAIAKAIDYLDQPPEADRIQTI